MSIDSANLTGAFEDLEMRRVSTSFTIIALTAEIGCALLPQGAATAAAEPAIHRPDFSAAGIDPMPVGTARQIARIKRARATRKA